MATDREIRDLFDLADRKGHSITKAIMRDHVNLFDPNGRRVKREDRGSTAFTYREAVEFLKAMPDVVNNERDR